MSRSEEYYDKVLSTLGECLHKDEVILGSHLLDARALFTWLFFGISTTIKCCALATTRQLSLIWLSQRLTTRYHGRFYELALKKL